MKTKIILTLLTIGVFYSCNMQDEILLKDCDAFGGIIKYKNELFTGKVKDIGENGKLKAEFSVVDGKKDGNYIKYHSDGKTKSSISKYTDGKILETTYFDEHGNATGTE